MNEVLFRNFLDICHILCARFEQGAIDLYGLFRCKWLEQRRNLLGKDLILVLSRLPTKW